MLLRELHIFGNNSSVEQPIGSNVVHPPKYPCPISVLRIKQRECATIEIRRLIIDDIPYSIICYCLKILYRHQVLINFMNTSLLIISETNKKSIGTQENMLTRPEWLGRLFMLILDSH